MYLITKQLFRVRRHQRSRTHAVTRRHDRTAPSFSTRASEAMRSRTAQRHIPSCVQKDRSGLQILSFVFVSYSF